MENISSDSSSSIDWPSRKRFKPCDPVGKLILKERKINYFLADRIFISSEFSTSSNNAAFIASGNTLQRLNYLGITKTDCRSSSVGYSFSQDVSQMDHQKLITVCKYVSQDLY
jgi:hypothetical protein